jgi:lipase chaperone LimK
VSKTPAFRAHGYVIAAAVLGIAAAAYSWQVGRHAPPGSAAVDAPADAMPSTDTSAASSGAAQRAASGFAIERSSLRDTEVDGGVSLDANGDVVLDLRLRRLFDYHLSLIGERELPQIRQLLETHLLGRYGARPAQTVLAYFDRYAGYLQRLAESRLGQSRDPKDRLAKVAALRRQTLGEAMATAFFADEEALAALTLKRMEIAADDTLSAARKSELLADLDRAAGHTARAEADTASLVADQNRAFELRRTTQAQRVAEREALWGKEAAQRLAALDEANARWDARIDAYLSARARIDADRTLSAAARAQAIAALRARRFDAAEQRRVESLEVIGQLKPGG